MNQKNENPISRQSKEWLRDSLFTLMNDENFNKITISEIASNAKLNRRTFYRNFKSKEEILNYHLDLLNDLYIESLKNIKDLSISNITRVFFEFWLNHFIFLNLLEKNNLLYLLLEHLNKQLPYIFKLFKGNKEEYTEDELEYVLSYSVGGYWNILKLWLKKGTNKNPKELSEMMEKAIRINLKNI